MYLIKSSGLKHSKQYFGGLEMSKKLHHHIVIEPELKGSLEKQRNETLKVFKGGNLFEGFIKNYTPKEDSGDPLQKEEKKVVTTVHERLKWTEKFIVSMLDYEITRDHCNQTANADLVVDGVVLVKNVPVSTLLSLEGRLKQIREVYDAMPTLDMSRPWEKVDGENHTYKYDIKTYRTAKKTVPVILYAATDKHPAQVKDVVEDVMIGTFDTTHFSGAVHPGIKASYLTRIDKLIESVKKARMHANEVEVNDRTIGLELFKYINS